MAPPACAPNHPSTAGLKKPIFGLSMIRSGTRPRAACLRTCFVRSLPNLEVAAGSVAQNSTNSWSRNGNAHLERVRHRRAVEVVEHVVGEAELRVEVQRAPPADRPAMPLPRRRSAARRAAPPSSARERAAHQSRCVTARRWRRSSRRAARRGPRAASVAGRPAEPAPGTPGCELLDGARAAAARAGAHAPTSAAARCLR